MRDPVYDPTADDIDQAHDVLDAPDSRDCRACRTRNAGPHRMHLALARGLVLIDAALAPADS